MSDAPSLHVAIVGGGLGGLAAALFLARAGHSATVFEQAPVLREVGAGVVVAPNMVRPLVRLGLAERLPDFAVRLEAAWEFRRWQDGRVLFSQPMGELCERLYGAPCWVAHRADLLAMLVRSLPAHPQVALRLDHRCVALRQDASGVDLDFVQRDGSRVQARADLVLGADGIHSTVSAALLSQSAQTAPAAPRFSGLCAWRCLVAAERAPALARRAVQTLWLGPGRHAVHYPISGGRLVNLVAIVPAGDWRTESWTAEGNLAELRAEFAGWDERLRQLIDCAQEPKRWALYDRDPLPRWTSGRVTLLGDAAHAMLPFFAQGAAQAIEDAEALAACLAGAGSDEVAEALQRYEAVRLPRTSEVQRQSRGREQRNHLPDGHAQGERDAHFAAADPLGESAWLYGHDAAAGV